jgi:branched-chain amino acid transport system substrate-binding protein
MMKKFILLTAKITLFLTFNSFASQGVSDTEIIIGIHTDISGPVSSFGKYSVEGIQMRMDEINKKGGINGRSLKLVAEDHQYQVPRAVQAANKLLNKDKIFLMVGSLGTSMNNAVFFFTRSKKCSKSFSSFIGSFNG